MKFLKRRLAGLGVAAILAASVIVAPSAPAHASGTPWHGCPVGAACLYSGPNFSDLGEIIAVWWEGVYTLSEVWGDHVVINNQTDNWVIELCQGWNGDYCSSKIRMDWGAGEPMDAINSVSLHPL